MLRLLAALVLAGVLHAQAPEPEKGATPAAQDSLGRTTPQDSAFHFLEACHAGDYSRALYYMDLRRMTPGARAKDGPVLAHQLEDILDDTPFEITGLSRYHFSRMFKLATGLAPLQYVAEQRLERARVLLTRGEL